MYARVQGECTWLKLELHNRGLTSARSGMGATKSLQPSYRRPVVVLKRPPLPVLQWHTVVVELDSGNLTQGPMHFGTAWGCGLRTNWNTKILLCCAEQVSRWHGCTEQH
eukprot:4370585-Amphidinium_carterae.1